MRSLLAISVFCVACSSDRPGLDSEKLEPADVDFNVDSVVGLETPLSGKLEWIGGGPSAGEYFDIQPSWGTTTFRMLIDEAGGVESLRRPCFSPAFGNHMPDCRAFLRIRVRVVYSSGDGALSEQVTGEVRAFGPNDWNLSAMSPMEERRGSLQVTDKTGGDLQMTLAAQFTAGRLVGSVGGLSERRWSNGATATGFTAGKYFLSIGDSVEGQ